MVKFWIYEILSIICYVLLFVLLKFGFPVNHPSFILSAIACIITMTRGIFSKKTTLAKKIGMTFFHLVVYIIAFFVFVGIWISIEWDFGAYGQIG